MGKGLAEPCRFIEGISPQRSTAAFPIRLATLRVASHLPREGEGERVSQDFANPTLTGSSGVIGR